MAKLKGPLFSLGASGAIGKALVYFGWKGLDVAREYVVPANPRSTDQLKVRGYLKLAVSMIHEDQARADHPLNGNDQVAYALKGSLIPTPRTWFNTIVKEIVYNFWRGRAASIFRDGGEVAGDTTLAVGIHGTDIKTGAIEAGTFWYGTSKSNLINSKPADITLPILAASATLDGLTNGIKYFWQFRPTTAGWEYSKSGIYYGTPVAD